MIQIHKKNSLIFLWLLLLSCFSCDKSTELIEFKNINNNSWEHSNSLTFNFEVLDTISSKNLFIHIRNTNEYSFSNIYLITTLSFPDETKIIDTLQYEMADKTGRFLGKGISTIKESKLFYKENKRFPTKGTFQFQVRQAMRKSGQIDPIKSLNGIQDVGFSVEKIN